MVSFPRERQIRASILATLRIPGADSHHERHSTLYDCLSQYDVSQSRSVRISEDEKRYYTLSRQCTESNCVRMYIVHCLFDSNCGDMHSVHGRLMVDNTYEFQHSSLAHFVPFDSRFASQTQPTQSVQASECRSDYRDSCTNAAWS